MMTEFTPERIDEARQIIKSDWLQKNSSKISDIATKAIDEIQKLQSRIAELEDELMFYQMECPDLVGRYQPPKDGE